MKIELPADFFSIINGKHLLLDTNVFIDAFSHPAEFGDLFNKLKNGENNVTLATLETVLIEFIKGSTTDIKLEEKRNFLKNIVDETFLPISSDYLENMISLLKKYKIEGKDLSITDLFLGATLLKYRRNICLLTKDISDFPTNVFDRITHINLMHRNTIQSYGVYAKS